MYNKTRRILELILGIVSVVAGALTLLASIVGLVVASYQAIIVVVAVFGFVFSLLFITFGVLFILKPKMQDGEWKSNKLLHIFLIVISALAFQYSIIACLLYLVAEVTTIFSLAATIISYFSWFVILATLPLNIVSMCLKVVKDGGKVNHTPQIETGIKERDFEREENTEEKAESDRQVKPQQKDGLLEEKVEQLKRLKESGVITEEEFKTAISKIVNNIVG